MIRGLPEKVWAASRKESRIARTGRHCAVSSGMSELGPQQRLVNVDHVRISTAFLVQGGVLNQLSVSGHVRCHQFQIQFARPAIHPDTLFGHETIELANLGCSVCLYDNHSHSGDLQGFAPVPSRSDKS
jgi:hypothetical protein